MICGPPGVGKTTVAKIIGKIYLELGFLENDKFKNIYLQKLKLVLETSRLKRINFL